MVRGLISERSCPWAVEPAGLNGSIRHQLSGQGSGGELERCLGAHAGAAGTRAPLLSRNLQAGRARQSPTGWSDQEFKDEEEAIMKTLKDME